MRLVTLAFAMARGPVSREELARSYGLYADRTVSEESRRRAFERDKKTLRAVGLDVEEVENRYRLRGSRTVHFSDSELDALTELAALVAEPETGAALGAFAGKAEAYPDLRLEDRLAADLPDDPNAGRLLDAITGQHAVMFDYRRVSGEPRTYTVEPWALRQRRGQWYVLSWDRADEQAKHFRLDRIAGEVRAEPPTDDGPTPPVAPRPEVLPSFDPPGPRGPVTVRLTGRGAFDALRLGASPDLDADTQEVELPPLRDEAALGFALSRDAEILDPPELADERARRLGRVADLHARPAPTPPEIAAESTQGAALDDARIRRLLALPGWLAERVDVTVEEAARAFGVEQAVLLEDLDVLRDVVLPEIGDAVDTYVQEDGTIHHVIGATLPLHLDVLTRARVRALISTAVTVSGEDEGLRRLHDRLQGPVVDQVDSDVDVDVLARLRDARDQRRRTTFLHSPRGSGDVTRRTLTPTRIDWANGHVYVGGWDHDREAPRWFRLDRVAAVEVHEVDEQQVGREVDLGEISYVPRSDETELVLRCTHVGTWVLNRTPPLGRVEEDDGTTWALVRTDSPEAVVDDVLVAAGEAEVVSPVELRQSVADRAAAQR